MMFARAACVVALAVLGNCVSAQTDRIAAAEVNKDGTVQIRFNSGRSIQVPVEKGQAGRQQLRVARNGRSAGWLVEDGPVGSYSVPTTLTVYAADKPLKHFGDGLMLRDWHFVDDDKHIEFSSSPVHGPGADWLQMEVHDIETGRLLRRWPARSDTAETTVPLSSIRGRVTDSRGAALPDTLVSVSDSSAAEPIALMISIEGGQFTLPGISPGEHELRFEHARFKKRAVKITVGPSPGTIDAGTVILEP
jgi:hypothetical protein